MALYYLDTSALVKRYRTERGMEVMAALFSDRTLDDMFITSQSHCSGGRGRRSKGFRGTTTYTKSAQNSTAIV